MLIHNINEIKKPKNVVIFGANGFIGKSLSVKLESEGISVKKLSRKDIDLLDRNASESLATLLTKDDVLVATSAIAPCKNPDMLKDNIKIAIAICKAAYNAGCCHVINISSDAVYADVDDLINENTTKSPDSFHGVMHLAREIIFNNQITEVLTNVRPTLIYGEGDTHNGYGPNQFSRLAKENLPIKLFGKGEERRDHVYIKDIVEVIYRIIQRRSSGVINIASGDVRSFLEIAEKVSEFSENTIDIHFRDRIGPMPHNGYRPFDISVYKELFPGFSFTPFEVGIKETLEKI